ncbi:MAG TPA: MFS transporter [Propionibacteriaceae bacterium]|nr:MFS transporter [Propionibacteriaceae bacterium]
MTSSEIVDQPTAAPAVSLRRLTVGLCINIVAIAFETIAVATAMPVAARELNGLDYYAWSFSVFVIGMLFATVVAGRLSDRIGPVKPLLVGMGIFVVGLLVAGSANFMIQLIGGRLIQGVGSGLMNTAIFVCVAQAYSVTQRPRMFTYISTAWILPSFVGPPISAWLTERFSWHWVFYAVVPLVVGGGLLVLPTLRRMMAAFTPAAAEAEPTRPAPLWAAGVVALAAAALQLAGQRLDWVALGLLVAGLAGLIFGLPQLMPACFNRFERGLPAVIVSRGLLAGAFVGGEAFVPLMLVEERLVALVLAGAALTVGSVGWMTGSWLQSRPWLRIRRDRLITFGCLSLTLGLGSTGLVAFLPGVPYYLVAAGWIFSGLGMGLATASTSLAVMTLSEPAVQGRNGSSLNLSDALGAGLFVGVSGTIFAALHDVTELSVTFGAVLGTMTIIAGLAALASLRIGPVRNEFSAAPES